MEGQDEGRERFEALVAQRDKLSARLSYVNELAEGDPEREALAPRVTASRQRFEQLLQGLAGWAGVGVGDVVGVLAVLDAKVALLDQEVHGAP